MDNIGSTGVRNMEVPIYLYFINSLETASLGKMGKMANKALSSLFEPDDTDELGYWVTATQ